MTDRSASVVPTPCPGWGFTNSFERGLARTCVWSQVLHVPLASRSAATSQEHDSVAGLFRKRADYSK